MLSTDSTVSYTKHLYYLIYLCKGLIHINFNQHKIPVRKTLAYFSMSYQCNAIVFPQGGFYLLNLFDVSLGGFPLLFIGLVECVAIVYVYGKMT